MVSHIISSTDRLSSTISHSVSDCSLASESILSKNLSTGVSTAVLQVIPQMAMVAAVLAIKYVSGLMFRVLIIGYDFSMMMSVLKNSAKVASRVCMAAKKLRLLKIQTVVPLLPMVMSPYVFGMYSCV